MRTATKVYVALVSGLGLSAGAWSAWVYLLQPWSPDHLITFGILVLLCMLCSCLPLYVRDDCTIDMSFISIIAITLLEGPAAAVTIYCITTPFVVISSLDGKSFRHIFNTDPIKTLFNLGNVTLSLFLAGLLYVPLGGVPGTITLPQALIPIGVYLFVSVLVNSLLMMGLFQLEGQIRFFPTVFQMLVQLLPSIACSSPIGLFLAVLLTMESGRYLAPLFLLPLLLARFSFKLFLRSQQQQYEIIRTLTAAIEAKDSYTEGHSRRVGVYASRIAAHMGLSEKRIRRLQTAAFFHDIGKIGVPDAILRKPGPLEPEEMAIIWTHPQIGLRILGNIDTTDDVTDLVLHHHERYDGRGYPDGLGGDALPVDVYILAAADTYDAITSDRPYRRGLSPQRAAEILRAESGAQFHPAVALAAADLIDRAILSAPIEPGPMME